MMIHSSKSRKRGRGAWDQVGMGVGSESLCQLGPRTLTNSAVELELLFLFLCESSSVGGSRSQSSASSSGESLRDTKKLVSRPDFFFFLEKSPWRQYGE